MWGEARVNICQAVTHGSNRYLKNTQKSEEGKILRCDDYGFEVEVGERREHWTFDEVEEQNSN